MDEGSVRQYLLDKPDATVGQPFGQGVDVYKVQGKMFATLIKRAAPDGRLCWQMNLKCDPHEALILREIFSAVVPGYHMDKRHWNTIILDGSIPDGELQRFIDNSYLLVVEKLPVKVKKRILMLLLDGQGKLE
ncbi:MmcQ/YjbR family DNA-binding protein [Pseudoalteromonas pernae]|uniref:MmcQ/YjbR family DNA-binding protein n=1 Tax=Pseudoalteromonas pernae TaxID=3118054 RepID=UPI003242D6D9